MKDQDSARSNIRIALDSYCRRWPCKSQKYWNLGLECAMYYDAGVAAVYICTLETRIIKVHLSLV
ncbi:unnamed protein product [Penicillium camemberti]|uniref:Str. FM013 n=1 Tax=Penicillium camemberti (strain FM 013) TaxID=1429867 RepID=A0A0G4PIQ7_PENC3|nr:unnamed protein product [Penicillium camemberti]